MTPEQAQALHDIVSHFEDGLMTAYETVTRLDEWRSGIDLDALLDEHERVTTTDDAEEVLPVL